MPQTFSKVSERNRAGGLTQPSWSVYSFFTSTKFVVIESSRLLFYLRCTDGCSIQFTDARYNSQMPDTITRWLPESAEANRLWHRTQFVRYTATRCHMIAGNQKVLSWLPERGEANRVGRLTPGAKIPQNSKLESARSPVPSHCTVGGGGVTKKGDRGYIRLIPRYNSNPPAEPSHHTQKISIVPLRITYADDPCIVLYLLPPKSPS